MADNEPFLARLAHERVIAVLRAADARAVPTARAAALVRALPAAPGAVAPPAAARSDWPASPPSTPGRTAVALEAGR